MNLTGWNAKSRLRCSQQLKLKGVEAGSLVRQRNVERQKANNKRGKLSWTVTCYDQRTEEALSSRPSSRREKAGKCLHGVTVSSRRRNKKEQKKRGDNKSKDRSKCVDVPAVTLQNRDGWLVGCAPVAAKSLRSRLKRVDPPTPACMATLFSFPHSPPLGCYWSRVQCASHNPITTHTWSQP